MRSNCSKLACLSHAYDLCSLEGNSKESFTREGTMYRGRRQIFLNELLALSLRVGDQIILQPPQVVLTFEVKEIFEEANYPR